MATTNTTSSNPAITQTPEQIAAQVQAMQNTVNAQATRPVTPAQTVTASQMNPGQSIIGAPTGTTQVGQGVAPAQTSYQAYTAPASNPADQAFLAQQQKQATEAAQLKANQQAELQKATAAGTTSYYDQATGTWKAGSSPETQAAQNQDVGMQLIQKQQQAIIDRLNSQQQAINASYDTRAKAIAQQQAAESGQSAMVLARMGAFGTTASGVSYMQKLDTSHQQQMSQLENERQAAIAQAQDAANSQNLDLAWKSLERIDKLNEEKRAAEAKNLENLKKYQEFQGQNFSQMAEAGYTLDEIPDDYFKHLDEVTNSYGVPVLDGTAKAAFVAAQKAYEVKQAKTAEDQRKSAFDAVKSIQEVVSKLSPGQSISIGNGTYFGVSGDAVVESDQSGNGRMLITSADGSQSVKQLGRIGQAGDYEVTYVNGQAMSFNKKTGITTPLVQSGGASGDAGWDKTICPDGITGGQCGEFIHNFVENYPYGANTVEQRAAIVNIPKDATPRVGDVLLQNYGSTGHSAMVNWVGQDGRGNTVIKLTESNFHGDGKVSNTRTVTTADPSILGYFRGQLRPHAQTGSDAMPAVYGPSLVRELPVSADTSGLNIPGGGFAEGFTGSASGLNAAREKDQQAAASAQGLISKDLKISDIPAGIRARALQIAKSNGWSAEKAEAGENVFAQGLIDGTVKLTDIPSADREAALSAAKKAGYTPAGNTKFQKMSDTAKTEFRDLLQMASQIESLDTLKKTGAAGEEQDTGPLATATNIARGWMNMANQNLLNMDAISQDLKSNIMKQRSGAAVQEAEVKRLSRFIPSISDNDQEFNSKLQHLKDTYDTMLENQAKIYGFKDLDEFKKEFGIGTAEQIGTAAGGVKKGDTQTLDGVVYTFDGTNWVSE